MDIKFFDLYYFIDMEGNIESYLGMINLHLSSHFQTGLPIENDDFYLYAEFYHILRLPVLKVKMMTVPKFRGVIYLVKIICYDATLKKAKYYGFANEV